MSEGPSTAHGGPVSNTGTANNLTPATAPMMAAPQQQPPVHVPLLSIPTPSNGSTTSTQATSGAGDPNKLQQPKIPPLMGIRTDTLPPPPPVQLPSTVAISSTPTPTAGEKVSVAGGDGAPKLGDPPRLQSKTQVLDQDEDSDGDDGKGEGDPAALYVNPNVCLCINCVYFITPFLCGSLSQVYEYKKFIYNSNMGLVYSFYIESVQLVCQIKLPSFSLFSPFVTLSQPIVRLHFQIESKKERAL